MSSVATPDVGPNKAGFVFGDADEDRPNMVTGMLPMQAYLVQYNDGEGKKQVRIALRPQGSPTTFLLQNRIQGAFVATEAVAWFNKEMLRALKESGLEVFGDEGSEGVRSA